MAKIDLIGRHGYHFEALKSGGCDESYFVHHVQGGPAKKRVVVVDGVRKNGFEDARFGAGNLVGKG